MLDDSLKPYCYLWPRSRLHDDPRWHPVGGNRFYTRSMPESMEEVAADSRWPAFFPAPMCLVTTADGSSVALEKEVGASIVNRFPLVMAVSFCKRGLSARHYARLVFTKILESSGCAAVQFLPPGWLLDSAMNAITSVPEEQTCSRIAYSRLPTRKALTNDAPVFDSAFLVYEASLVQPDKDLEGKPIFAKPWIDVGSHRVYYLLITAIQLRQDIAEGRSQILWRSLPEWQPWFDLQDSNPEERDSEEDDSVQHKGYRKGFTPHYAFPSANTIAFEFDTVENGMAVLHLPPQLEDQLDVDKDKGGFPCFFPSSIGMITTWAEDGVPNLMPCGSTTVVCRHPMVIAPCVNYAAINERLFRRATMDIIQRTGKFGCGVPFINDEVLFAIKYTGNTSLARDPKKLVHVGLRVEKAGETPVLPSLPVHFDCQVVGEVRLGTHCMFLGEVRRIWVRADVTPDNPLEWCPWAAVVPVRE